MGKKTILQPIHNRFLEAVNQEKYLTSNYYWTGGTVLAEFYLHHRLSEDIDLFTEDKEVYLPSIRTFIQKFATKTKAKKITHSNFLGLESFVLSYPQLTFKVDFNFYPFPRINKGGKWKNIAIDSLEDIAVNKIHTISMRQRTRDFIDVYFILKQTTFDLSYLIRQAKAKFDWDIDPVQLGHKFAQIVTLKDYPKMLIAFDQKDMEKFFLHLAKSLEKEIFK